ncbi:hypothetical protein CFIO01_03462 [Colletotrichum fioriniae PJ7]|uniref:Uncharacterized protein n=1 Tax=Colletotrichum fioriniae PJ7 TaxID=1445577 RepID=A0A010R8W7_9PEZI|nr:hypothetical protein CFIO01_03462 [Colletotrichum fioriniae PJ7]
MPSRAIFSMGPGSREAGDEAQHQSKDAAAATAVAAAAIFFASYLTQPPLPSSTSAAQGRPQTIKWLPTSAPAPATSPCHLSHVPSHSALFRELHPVYGERRDYLTLLPVRRRIALLLDYQGRTQLALRKPLTHKGNNKCRVSSNYRVASRESRPLALDQLLRLSSSQRKVNPSSTLQRRRQKA